MTPAQPPHPPHPPQPARTSQPQHATLAATSSRHPEVQAQYLHDLRAERAVFPERRPCPWAWEKFYLKQGELRRAGHAIFMHGLGSSGPPADDPVAEPEAWAPEPSVCEHQDRFGRALQANLPRV